MGEKVGVMEVVKVGEKVEVMVHLWDADGVRRGAQLCMHVTRSLVRGRHTRPWSWPMALWFPHAAWGRGLTHGGRERS